MIILLEDFLKNKPKRSSQFYFNIGDIVQWDDKSIKILSQYHKEQDKYYKARCGKCDGEYDVREANIFHKKGCPYCDGKKVLIGFNDIATTNPELQQYMLNKDDAYKYLKYSNKRISWICPICKTIVKNKPIYFITEKGFSCPKCSDGISFPNKFMFNLLMQTNLCFEREASLNGNTNMRYDFYIEEISTIIEMHGGQHYMDAWTTCKEINKRDIEKKEYAIENGIKNYIEIDARKSEFDFIKYNVIQSDLNKFIDFSKIDWGICYKETVKPIIPMVCELWNQGYCNSEILERIPILDITTISRYLSIGNEIGLCDYDGKEGIKRGRKLMNHMVKCKTNNQIFNSIKEARQWCNLKSGSGIIACCNGYRKFAGKDPVTKEKLQWEYE